MQIVIDISDEIYNIVKKRNLRFDEIYEIEESIRNGTPLPKGHGRLIDADYLKDVILLHSYHGNNKNIVPYSDRKGYRLRQREIDEGIVNAPTILEADGGDK